jgi:hypothetical protein
MAKVGVWPVPICTVALGAGAAGLMHCPFAGFVSQRERVTGKLARPVSAVTVIVALAPRFTAATANTPVPSGPRMLIIPSSVVVAPTAMMSGLGASIADRSRVVTPEMVSAGAVLAQR